jgi:hypothetical protein
MPIQFKCPECGKQYKVADEAAGKRTKCRECDNPIQIPMAKRKESQDDFLSEAAHLESSLMSHEGTTDAKFLPRTGSSESWKSEGTSSGKLLLFVGIGAGALLLCVVLVCALMLGGGSGDGEQTVADAETETSNAESKPGDSASQASEATQQPDTEPQGNEEVVTELLELLKQRPELRKSVVFSEDKRRYQERVRTFIKEEGLQRLIEVLRAPDVEGRVLAAQALAFVEPADAHAALPALRELVWDRRECTKTIRERVMNRSSVSNSYGEEVSTSIQPTFRTRIVTLVAAEEARKALRHIVGHEVDESFLVEGVVRGASVYALEEFMSHVPQSKTALATLIRYYECSQEPRFDRFRHNCIYALRALLMHEDPAVRKETAQRLGRLGPLASPFAPRLRERSTVAKDRWQSKTCDEDPSVREAAKLALDEITRAGSDVTGDGQGELQVADEFAPLMETAEYKELFASTFASLLSKPRHDQPIGVGIWFGGPADEDHLEQLRCLPDPFRVLGVANGSVAGGASKGCAVSQQTLLREVMQKTGSQCATYSDGKKLLEDQPVSVVLFVGFLRSDTPLIDVGAPMQLNSSESMERALCWSMQAGREVFVMASKSDGVQWMPFGKPDYLGEEDNPVLCARKYQRIAGWGRLDASDFECFTQSVHSREPSTLDFSASPHPYRTQILEDDASDFEDLRRAVESREPPR